MGCYMTAFKAACELEDLLWELVPLVTAAQELASEAGTEQRMVPILKGHYVPLPAFLASVATSLDLVAKEGILGR